MYQKNNYDNFLKFLEYFKNNYLLKYDTDNLIIIIIWNIQHNNISGLFNNYLDNHFPKKKKKFFILFFLKKIFFYFIKKN